MTLTLSPTTSIRPLGEEHLRMFRRVTGSAHEAAPVITIPKKASDWPKGMPRPIDVSYFMAQGVKYRVLRFGKSRPNLKQTIEIAEHIGFPMLTLREARALKWEKNEGSNKAFEDNLKFREWAYIRDPATEKQSKSSLIDHFAENWFDIIQGVTPNDGAPVVILKEVI